MACFRHGFPGRFGRNPHREPGGRVVVGEEELLVERAVARLVAAASAATGPAGAGEGPFPARSGVHEVSGGALGHGDLATLTAPSLFGGGCVVVIRDAHNAGKDVADELTRLAAEPPPDVRLVVTHAGGAKGKALLASLAGNGARVIEYPKITRVGDRMDFVREEFRAAGRTIDDGGVRALIDALGLRPAGDRLRVRAAGRRHHRRDRPARGGQVLPRAGRGQRVLGGRPGGGGAPRRRARAAALGARRWGWRRC